MESIKIRKASLDDLEFIAKAIIAAEKSNSNKLGLSTLFNLSENQVRKYIIDMLKEEIDGCEYSVSSFLITEKGNSKLGAVSGWIEGFNDELPSSVLKSNLLSFTFPRENLKYLHTHSADVNDILIPRELNSLQIEYVYVDPGNRGRGFAGKMIENHIDHAKKVMPRIKKAQVQVFKNNPGAIKAYEKIGFIKVKEYIAKSEKILSLLPFNTKILMEKMIDGNSGH